MNHIRVLSVDIGTRPRGTENDRRAAEYIRSQLASYGYATELQNFPVEIGEYPLGNVDVLAPDQRVIGAWGLAGSMLGTVEGEVVFAGIGTSAQFPANTAGRIAVIERGEIFFSEKVANAQAAGAIGVIIYNNETDGFQGNIDSSNVPAVSITGSDGRALRAQLEAGTVHVRITTSADVESQNVIGRPPGGTCRMVVGGHHDSVPNGPGANDNASGTGVVIEMARSLAADGAFDNICFVLFGGEESGLLGSIYYVSRLSEEERGAMVGMLNFDMLAVGEGWPFSGSTELVNVAGEAAEALGVGYEITGGPDGVGSDHASFAEAGIPAMMFNCFCDANWHTPGDRFEFIRPERVEQAGNIGLGTIARLLP
jgi:aminopeptidase YwaD